ncbi:hypothetical protein QJQ45_011579 [Haematococcus lacustris]|nr:hypothetical protein QJQ45_011579 [Haematococcus lacustris]
MVLSKLVWGLTRQARKLSSAQDACLATLPLRAMSSAPAPVEERPLPELPGFPYTPKQYAGPSAAEVLAIRKKYLSPSLFHHFRKPVMIVEGKAQYLFDETGRRYLDAFAGIVTVSVGHCHPEVVKAVNQQSEILQHTTTIYLNHQIAEYAKELADKMPGNLKCVYFVNSGSEANDMAMMLARTFTGNWDLIGLRNAYHGMSIATMGTCGQHTWKQPMPQGFGIHHALNPDPYRGVFGNDGPAYARDVQDLIQSATSGKVAGFMAETIQGVGGATPLAAGYLPEVYKMVRAAGGITIADEVQTGFGRTGSAYWGFQNQGVLPDIVTMAKGMGNGLPLAAVVTTPEIAASMASRLHFNTFGGNPVCSAGGRAVLRVIDNEQLQANCARVGQHLVARLQQLAQKHSIIGDVRGQGLMLGVEFVKDKATKEPASKEVVEVMERMKDMGVLMGKGGIYGNVFRIKPPMCFNIADADFLEPKSMSLGQRVLALGTAALMTVGSMSGAAVASEFDLLAEPAPTTSYYLDDASVLSISTKGDLNKKLKELEESTGYRVEVITVRKLEYETDAFAFSDKLLANWYPKAERDNKGVLMVVTAAKEGALTGGAAFMDAIGDELLDSIVGDQIPIYTEQEKYNLTVESSLERVIAKLEGKTVPAGPVRADDTKRRTYRTKEETDKSKNITATVVASLLLIAVVVPMLQYYGYVAKD